MKHDGDITERLRQEITRAIVLHTGTREQIAMPYADAVIAYLQQEYSGQRIYIPAPPRQHNILQIDASLRAGVSPAKVCEQHNISYRTLQRFFPAGLPSKTPAQRSG